MATIEAIRDTFSGILMARTWGDRDLEIAVLLGAGAIGLDLAELRSWAPSEKWVICEAAEYCEGRSTIVDFSAGDSIVVHRSDLIVEITAFDSVYTLTVTKNRHGEDGAAVEFFVHNGRYVDFAEARRLLKARAS